MPNIKNKPVAEAYAKCVGDYPGIETVFVRYPCMVEDVNDHQEYNSCGIYSIHGELKIALSDAGDGKSEKYGWSVIL